jgi:hypothetical protein
MLADFNGTLVCDGYNFLRQRWQSTSLQCFRVHAAHAGQSFDCGGPGLEVDLESALARHQQTVHDVARAPAKIAS